MQFVEKAGEGLSRTYGVTVPAAELGAALDARIAEILPTLKLKGFRPGKVPKAHVRRLYGKALMGEVVDKTLSDTSQRVLNEQRLRIASPPDLKPVSDMEQVLAGREDLAYDIDVEVMPEFEPIDVSTLVLERPVYRTSEAELDAALSDLVAQNRTYEDRVAEAPEDLPAAQPGDQLSIDFVGRVDGEVFEGGEAADLDIVLGSGRFIAGFEEQLIGAQSGETRRVEITFPEDYPAERLKGKAAVFEVVVKAVRSPVAAPAEADDELARRLGLADLETLKRAVRENLEQPFAQASRFKLKRALLDALDAAHDIPLPPRMVRAEFDGIWAQVEKDRESGEVSPEDAGKSEADLRAEYAKIAERRVRLGLVLAEIGRRANVAVTDVELGDAVRAEARRYGERAGEIFNILRGNPNVLAQIRAPLFEEKVVDYIIGRATVTDLEVTKDELMREDDLPEGYAAASADVVGDVIDLETGPDPWAEPETPPDAAPEPVAAEAPVPADLP
jgi:trigger factor